MKKCDVCGGSIKYVNGHIAKCEYCGRMFQVEGDILKEANIDSFYREANGLLRKNDEQSISCAVDIFEALGAYKDSSDRAYEGKGKISAAKALEADRILEEKRNQELAAIERKKAEIKQKENRKFISIVAVIIAVVVIAIITISSISKSRKNAQYERALSYYHQQDYETAIAEFEKLDGYKDSRERIAEIQGLIAEIERLEAERERTYDKAVKYFEEGLYQEAISSFATISDYLDSSDYLEKSYGEILADAQAKYESEQYQECINLVSLIPDTSDCYAKALAIKKEADAILTEIQNAQTYENALDAYNSQDYEKAQKLFAQIVGYEDANVYLDTIGEYYYGLATNYYSAGNYPSCCDILLFIDTAQEWTNYSLAKDLFNNAIDAYCQAVKAEAKAICRRDGEAAMRQYIDSMVCSALDNTTATTLKSECVINQVSLERLSSYVVGGFGLYKDNSVTDILGNTYQYGITGSLCLGEAGTYGGSYETYNIEGKYKYFIATVAIRKPSWDVSIADKKGQIRIYGDDRLLWSNEAIMGNTKPYEIMVDVEGVEDLRIEIYRDGRMDSLVSMYPYLCNPTLSE